MTSSIPNMLSLDEMIEDWAMDMFKATTTKEQAKIPKDALQMTINWKRANFYHGEPNYDDKRSSPKPDSQVLFQSDFTNNTDSEQEYSFKTSRTTRSTCEVEFEQGYTIGQEVGFSLKTPCEVFEANVGFHREISLYKTDREVIEEELSWEVDSQIRVPSKRRTQAKLVISEKEFGARFTMETTITGTVTVVFTNLNENNSFVKCVDGDLVEIFRDAIRRRKLKTFVVEDRTVKTKVIGKCQFRFGIEQHVQLAESDITSDPKLLNGRL